ncbi:bglC [Symbiodinium natans]|uniref:BglC protein n=1 Tax=Symbiodinium natans TaxID=878477 RepID=A0A812UL07_9DINO|nr:bglC [Symbiodinium natans]
MALRPTHSAGRPRLFFSSEKARKGTTFCGLRLIMSGRRKVPRRTRTMTNLLYVSAVVATANGSSIGSTEIRCTELPTSPGGCDSEAVAGACYSTRTGVNWACGAPSSSCMTVPLPPPNGGAYEGYCSFAGDTVTATSTSRSTTVSGTSTTHTTTSSVSTSSLSTSSVTMTTTLPFPPEGSPVAEHGQLRVVGTQIVGQHGESVRLRGMSLFWSQWGGAYWNEDTLRWLRRDWGIEMIRAAMGVEAGGYLDRPDIELHKLKRVIYAAHALGIYVIVDWHDHHAIRNAAKAKTFFREIAKTYGHLPNVLFETFNEPTWQSWSQAVKPYHQNILKVIREYSDNIVICGTPTWSQDVDVASHHRIQGVKNIVYTLHFYAGTHTQYLRDKALKALDSGVALFVSEWGTCEANGNGHLDLEEAQKWEDFMAEYNISDANWAVNDKKESCSALEPGAATNGHWGPADLTPSGRWVRASLRHHAFGTPLPWVSTTDAPSAGNASEQNDTQISSSTDSASESDRRLNSQQALYDLPLSAAVTKTYNTVAVVLAFGLLLFPWSCPS